METHDSLDDKLSINKQNRHQYLETSIVSATDAEREITLAIVRSRQRLQREKQRKVLLVKVGGVFLIVAIAVAAVAAVLWLT